MAEIAESAGVGVGTLYRHFPTREALLTALTHRSFHIALENARRAAAESRPALQSLMGFFEHTIQRREELILPLHGGPVFDDAETDRLRAQIREALEEVLERGRREGTVRVGVSARDIVVSGALLAQPLPGMPNWDVVARRQARLILSGLGAIDDASLTGRSHPQARRTRPAHADGS